jgi:phage shock protein PspC (stress-responsive transcriptional regulator)
LSIFYGAGLGEVFYFGRVVINLFLWFSILFGATPHAVQYRTVDLFMIAWITMRGSAITGDTLVHRGKRAFLINLI